MDCASVITDIVVPVCSALLGGGLTLLGVYLTIRKQDKKDNFIQYQSCIIISIQGDLRDKDGETTKEEFINFLNYIKAKYIVRDYSINIEDEWRDESITKI